MRDAPLAEELGVAHGSGIRGRRNDSTFQKMSGGQFSELCFPGVEIGPTPRGSILHTTRASQLPYYAKYAFPKIFDIWGLGSRV